MKYNYLLLILLLAAACKKDAMVIDCSALQQSLTNKDVAKVEKLLNNLLNVPYSEQNLNALADKIEESCPITAVFSCFECIKTLPPQSEMSLEFLNGGDSTLRVLDFMPSANNKIKLLNVQ